MDKSNFDLAGIKHIAIIADGNGRWAKRRKMPRAYGHKAGADNIRKLSKTCLEIGLPILSIFCLSTENLKRPKEELDFLFSLVPSFYDKYSEELRKEKIRTVFCGSRDGLPDEVLQLMDKTERISAERSPDDYSMKLVICFNYGGRDEIARAVSKVLLSPEEAPTREKLQSMTEPGAEPWKEINAAIERNLYLPDLPFPDLIIRTAGEMRLSNFWLWQAAYSEFFSSKAYWPDFDEADLKEAIDSYKSRERRFGLLGADSGEVAPLPEEN